MDRLTWMNGASHLKCHPIQCLLWSCKAEGDLSLKYFKQNNEEASTSRQTRCAGFSSHPWFLHLGTNKHVHLLFLSLIFASRTQEACALWKQVAKVINPGRQSTTWYITQLRVRVKLWYILIVIPKTSYIQLNRLSHYRGIWIWMHGLGYKHEA
jgi:hypothetical protein